jgi:hypothetical protein
MNQRTSAGGGHRRVPHSVGNSGEQGGSFPQALGMRRGVWVGGSVFGLLVLAVILTVASGCAYQRKPAPPTQTSTPAPTSTATPAAPTATVTPVPNLPAENGTPTPQPTLEPGAQVIVVTPKPVGVGWWASGDVRANHLGDSFLYSGYFNSQVFVSAVRFDLRAIPRGAAIQRVSLQITGLRNDRFTPSAGGAWSVQLLSAAGMDDLSRVSFQQLFNASASVTLFPILQPDSLQVGQPSTLTLDASGQEWLAQQLLDAKQNILLRITGPAGGNDTLFAWDSGTGPATGGAAPQLAVVIGAAPATPPPLPTQPFIVATLTPTPANIMTAAVDMLTATAEATANQAGDRVIYVAVTPTPAAPIVIYTPTPANAATATVNAAYATAVAVTTGTFTPVPPNAVTPIIVMPTPRPENVLTAAVQVAAGTAQAQKFGTPTMLPFNALIATATATPEMITATPLPGNAATAQAYAAYATAVAMTTGTFTPIPAQAITPTPPPPTPLVLFMDQMPPTPVRSPTPTPGSSVPRSLVGKILFYSDRDGGPQLFALDPANGRLAYVTQPWPYILAMATEPIAPDGKTTVVVQDRTDTVERQPGCFVNHDDGRGPQLLIHDKGVCYDPVWSPKGDRIALVDTEAGNDEIYVINPDGNGLQRLTVNNWEWDKHPSWSPDGSQIVFWSNRETGRRQLWIMNADGSNQRRLLISAFNDWDPVWVK